MERGGRKGAWKVPKGIGAVLVPLSLVHILNKNLFQSSKITGILLYHDQI